MLKAIRDLIAELHIARHRSDVLGASGWVYVTKDDESGNYVCANGPFETPEAALIAAQEQTNEDKKWLGPDERGWQHIVLPLYPP
jgi:hypothetical protein